MQKKSIEEVLQGAEFMLLTAHHGLEDMRRIPGRLRSGFANVVNWGRSVTFALPHLKNLVQDFGAWYAPEMAKLEADPVANYMYKLRNEIVKEGESISISSTVVIHNLQIDRDFGERPPGSVGAFIGDSEGNSGWMIKTPSGEIEKYYISLSPNLVSTYISMNNPPKVNGVPIDSPIELARLYLFSISSLVSEARQRYGTPQLQ